MGKQCCSQADYNPMDVNSPDIHMDEQSQGLFCTNIDSWKKKRQSNAGQNAILKPQPQTIGRRSTAGGIRQSSRSRGFSNKVIFNEISSNSQKSIVFDEEEHQIMMEKARQMQYGFRERKDTALSNTYEREVCLPKTTEEDAGMSLIDF